MDYTKELQKINNEYYPIIKSKYKEYIKNFNKIPDMTQNVFILSDEQCVGEHEDLLKMRGKCVTETGYIYIRKSKFNKHVLVHEFIHRLSRNYLDCGWVEGISVETDIIDYNGLSEVLTEWFAYKITKIDEPTIYQKHMHIFDDFIKRDICNIEYLATAFFSGNENDIFTMFVASVVYNDNRINVTPTDIEKAIAKINEISRTIKHIDLKTL